MSHCNNRIEAIQKKGKNHIAWLEANGWDTYYNKQRNFPDAEERLYDGSESIPLALSKAGQTKGGTLVYGRFLPGGHTHCMLCKTKRELLRHGWNFEADELCITDDQQTYKITNAHFNSCPVYPVFDLIPTGKHEARFYQEALKWI